METEKKEEFSRAVAQPVDEIEERKRKVIGFIKKKSNWIYYLILSFLVFLTIYIRTRNIPKLKDITTGGWTLGPDLDPFLFLRWAEYIVEHGKLMVNDTMRYVPLGYDTSGEMKLLSYMIAWFHNGISFFTGETSVTYSAILFPVFMAALTAIAFFLFAREIFYKENDKTKNIIALIATAIFIVIPSMLARTIAGIPEKESAAFFFMFIAFYFFIKAFNSEKTKSAIIFGILAGLSTGLMALIWGGSLFIFFTITPAVFFAFLLGKINSKKLLVYGLWIITSLFMMAFFSTRYNLINLLTSLSTGSGILALMIMSICLIIKDNKKLKEIKEKTKLSKEKFYFLIGCSLILVFIIIISIIFGWNFFPSQISGIKSALITPISDRFSMTVAENRQPYFDIEWKSEFGPVTLGIPLYFWLFVFGSVLLFNNLVKNLNKKEKIILTLSYFILLICMVFSRHAPDSILNGTSGLSLLVYFGGVLLFIGCFGYFYYKKYKEGNFSVFKEFEFSYILYFIVLTLGLIGARGGIRLIMVLGAISPVAVAFLIVKTIQKFSNEKEETMKFFIGIIMIAVLLSSIFTFWVYYKNVKFSAENFAPSSYTWQWQKAMGWVRENTSENAVFAHWWDYGYWLQSIGKRATILDGGNAITYWDHLMGRYVLTGDDEEKALEFLYTHNGTHLLIDSTDIGKYTAFSSIGSDENYDRFSWISTFLLDERQIRETNNETLYIYMGGTATDDDITLEENGKEILLPKKRTGIGAIIIKKDKDNEIQQPEAIFVYNNKQYTQPIRYAYVDKKLHDFGEGLDAGVFVFPKLDILQDGRANINNEGALVYLSKRTVHSQLAKLYLFDEKSDYFKLAHIESSPVTSSLRQQGLNISEIVYYQGVQGPIKIWEISYPKNIKPNPDFLKTEYPKELSDAKPGEYNT